MKITCRPHRVPLQGKGKEW